MKWVKGGQYQIIYLDQENQITSRRIKIIMEQEYAVLAYCYEKKQIRRFLKEGILSYKKIYTPAEWLPSERNFHS